MKNFYDISGEEALKELDSDVKNGLSAASASERLKKYGRNKLEGKKEKTFFQMLLSQFTDFLVIILIIAAIVSIGMKDYTEGIVIIAIVILNGILGVTQENKASNALKALKELSSPLAKVLRDGAVIKIQSDEVVPGDIVFLEAGDYIPADLRLIETVNLKIDESALTGESVSAEKKVDVVLPDNAGLGDRVNCAYMGTVVTYGRGMGVVCHTGMKTQMGSIAAMLEDTKEGTTPLQNKLNSFGKILGLVCLAICLIIFGIGVLRGLELQEMFMISVSLAVAAIPEGLTVVVTVILALGMQKMVKVNAIVKKLSAVETLGSTTVICSDKTGTLTQNKMTVLEIFDGSAFYNVSGTGYSVEGEITNSDSGEKSESDHLSKILTAAVLCNDSIYNKEEQQIIGDPTEGALLVVGAKYGVSSDELKAKYPRIQELPFDSDRKLMSTFHNIDGKIIMFTKGAPDEILRRSTSIYKDGSAQQMTINLREQVLSANETYAKRALRVLGVAYKEIGDIKEADLINAEQDLVFCGLLGMIDPPRDEVKTAIEVCKNAGIQVKMITGDHKVTAAAIAEQIGIHSQTPAIDGNEIESLSSDALKEKVRTTNVFARVSPEHKVRLVEAIKANGNIVAMTGDGVNDAPSLKKADIGIAMGITGTDVSKEAADMILTDDNFATIVRSVEEGRTIYNNIKKVVGYLLSCNIGEILLIFIAMLAGMPVPLGAIQLLSINLVTDAFPAFALGMEEKEEGVMNNPPRDPREPIVNKRLLSLVLAQSVFLALSCLGAYMYGHFIIGNEQTARTMCFVTIVLEELLRAYSARSETTTLLRMNVFNNSFLNKSVLASIAFLLLAVYVPFLQPVFDTHALELTLMFTCLGFAIFAVAGNEISKAVVKKVYSKAR